jgi:formate hydrogenlyase subunit 3/multisubunit Na+/H+ antiporter MnhD subunit
MTNILLAILFLPILSAAAITLFTLRRPTVSAGISIGSCCLTFILSVLLYRGAVSQGLPLEISFTGSGRSSLVELGFPGGIG